MAPRTVDAGQMPPTGAQRAAPAGTIVRRRLRRPHAIIVRDLIHFRAAGSLRYRERISNGCGDLRASSHPAPGGRAARRASGRGALTTPGRHTPSPVSASRPAPHREVVDGDDGHDQPQRHERRHRGLREVTAAIARPMACGPRARIATPSPGGGHAARSGAAVPALLASCCRCSLQPFTPVHRVLSPGTLEASGARVARRDDGATRSMSQFQVRVEPPGRHDANAQESGFTPIDGTLTTPSPVVAGHDGGITLANP